MKYYLILLILLTPCCVASKNKIVSEGKEKNSSKISNEFARNLSREVSQCLKSGLKCKYEIKGPALKSSRIELKDCFYKSVNYESIERVSKSYILDEHADGVEVLFKEIPGCPMILMSYRAEGLNKPSTVYFYYMAD